MRAPDALCKQYEALLSGTYDCVDRIVLNAYFIPAQSPGGFRCWWRQLFGTDEQLDDTHLMRLAGRFSRRLRASAKKNGIPLLYVADDRKCDMAECHAPADPAFAGVYCIICGRAPAPVRQVRRFGTGGLDIRIGKPYQYVNHYSFYIQDPQWGKLVIRFCPHPPFNAMIILNGHHYVAAEATRRRLQFLKEDNCFTDVSSAAGLDRIAEAMRAPCSVGQLEEVCERWIYSAALCFALDLGQQRACGFRYSYSVYQCEYSRNLLFRAAGQMEQVFDALIDRNRARLDLKTVKAIFGRKRRPSRRGRKGRRPRIEIAVEKPVHTLTIFKIHFGLLTVKMYSKGERVLRIEVIVHNAKREFPRHGIQAFPQIVQTLGDIVARFLNALQGMDACSIGERTLETWTLPSVVGHTPVGGMDMTRPRMRAVAQAVVALAADRRGFTSAQVAAKVAEILRASPQTYRPTQAAYDLRKMRGKDLVSRVGSSRRYICTDHGLRSLAAFDAIYTQVLLPLLANPASVPARRNEPVSEIDSHYARIRNQMQALFSDLGISAAA